MTDIDAIRQREQAADPAPWTAHPDGLVWSQLIGDPVSGSVLVENAEFIAHARTDIPALLDLLATAQQDIRDRYEQIARLERHIAGLETQCNEQMHALTAERDQMKAQLGGATDQAYLIWSHHHDAWWGPNASGYRGNVADAGRYALADTKKHLGRGCYCCPVPEVAMPAPLPGQMDSASLANLIAVATEAEVAAGRVNKYADTAVTS